MSLKQQLRFARELIEPLRVSPGRTVGLDEDFDPGYTGGLSGKVEAGARLSEGISLLAEYQDRLIWRGVCQGAVVIGRWVSALGCCMVAWAAPGAPRA